MFKNNFKAAFGWVLGFAAGCYAADMIGKAIKQVCKTYNEEKQEEEKSKADIWEESIK